MTFFNLKVLGARRAPRRSVGLLVLKHRYLTLIVKVPTPRTPCCSDYRQYGQRLQRRAWHEDALRVRTLIRRINQKAFRRGLGKVGGHEAFKDLVVLKAQAHPQAFGSRTGSESLAGQRL